MDWPALLQYLGSFGIGAAALSYLVRRLVEHSLSKDLDRFKASLQSEHDVAIERLRADLRVTAFSKETKVAALHARRAEVIAELYSRLAALHWAFHDLLYPIQIGGKELHAKKREEAAKLANEFLVFFNVNRIYFDESFCERLDKLDVTVKRAWAGFTSYSSEFPAPDIWLKVWEEFDKEVPPLRREIEGKLRSLMGVSDEPQQAKDEERSG